LLGDIPHMGTIYISTCRKYGWSFFVINGVRPLWLIWETTYISLSREKEVEYFFVKILIFLKGFCRN